MSKVARKEPVGAKKTAPPANEVPFDPYAEVLAKYLQSGWNAFRTPPNSGIVDIMARKDEIKGARKIPHTKFHFVQVLTPETSNDIKFHGESKNTFIQNAFSNSAEPVHAHVTRRQTAGATKICFKFENANSGKTTRII